MVKTNSLVLVCLLVMFMAGHAKSQEASLIISDSTNPDGYGNASRVTVTKNQEVTFTCILSSLIDEKESGVIWRKDNEDLPAETITKEGLLSSIKTIALVLSPTISDHDKYLECISLNAGVETNAVYVLLLVEGPPDAPTLTGSGTIIAGDEVEFKCVANNGFPAPQIQWHLNGINIATDLNTKIEISNTTSNRINAASTLMLTPAKKHNQGALQCMVSHKTLPEPFKTKMVLNVLFCAGSLTLPCPRSIMNGTEQSFICSSSEGNPVPNIVWRIYGEGYFTDNIKNKNSKTGVNFGGMKRIETNTRLVTRKDHGKTLQCQSTQMLERTLDCRGLTGECVLNVLFHPVIQSFNDIEVVEGNSMSIECEVDANPPANSTWTKTDSLSSQSNSNTGTLLSFKNTTKEDAGTYRCQAENNIGNMDEDVDVFVLYSPSDTSQTIVVRSTSVNVGDDIAISCEVEGYPLPSVAWYSPNGTVILDGARMTIRNNVTGTRFRPIFQSKLEISETTMRWDNGTFRCEATNTIGIENILIAVQILSPGTGNRFSRGVMSLLIIIGLAIIVTCVVVLLVVLLRRRQRGNYSTAGTRVAISLQTEERPRSVVAEFVRKKKVVAQNSYAENTPLADKIQLTDMDNQSPYANITANFAFPRNNLTIVNELGQGAFGKVLLAKAKGIMGISGETEVAVKMLKEEAPASDREALLQEVELMKMLKPHANVIRLLGCCTEMDPIYVIVEYMANGNLKIFLRKSRNQDKNAIYSNLHGSSVTLTLTQLLRFAQETATGMDYLSSQKCIHRDLAARNVLVNNNLVCKVSDFGLARDVMNIRVYQKAREEFRLPVRWMAIESIVDTIFTTESDVWSFGILLWEIITLGARPYPGTDTKDVITGLKAGMRMPCPSHCPSEIFEIMNSCWAENPSDRPSFSQIAKMLKDLLEMESMHSAMEPPEEKLYESTEIALTNEKL